METTLCGYQGDSRSSKPVADKELLSYEDLDSYLLNEEEKQKRCAIWEKNYRGFMDERARKQKDREQAAAAALSGEEMYTQSGKLKKKYTKRAGNKNSTAARTAAEAAMQYVGQYVKPSSRKINYEALKVHFAAPDSSSSLASNTGPHFQQTTSSSFVNKSILKSGGAILSSSMNNNSSSSKSNAAAATSGTGAAVRFAPPPEVDEEVYEEDEEMVVGGPSVMYEDNDYDEYGGDEYY
eukprot:gene29417-38511_t